MIYLLITTLHQRQLVTKYIRRLIDYPRRITSIGIRRWYALTGGR